MTAIISHRKENMPENCLDCKFHKIINDPDPSDWFCDDDVAVVCTNPTAPKNEKFDVASRYESDKQPFKSITVSCRPHHTRKESSVPDWCPLADSDDTLNAEIVGLA